MYVVALSCLSFFHQRVRGSVPKLSSACIIDSIEKRDATGQDIFRDVTAVKINESSSK